MKKRVLMTYMESGMGHITSIKSISDSLKNYYGNEFEIIDSYICQEDNDKVLLNFEKFIIGQTKNTNRIKGYGNFVFFLMNILGKQRFMVLLHNILFRRALKHMMTAMQKHAPDVIVSTHYFMTFCAVEYKRRVDPNVKIITYNPDNNVHVWWDRRDGIFIVNNEQAFFEAIDY